MNKELYDLHLKAGLKAGLEKTCGKKNKYSSFNSAVKAADSHNKWKDRRHDVEPYPCAFCQLWHVGNIMPIEILSEHSEL